MNALATLDPRRKAGTGRAFPSATLALAVLAGAPAAQLTYPGCDSILASEFKKVPLRTLNLGRATKFAIAGDGRIIVGAQSGQISIVDLAANTQVEAGRITGISGSIWGVAGIALDPDFLANGRIFVYCSRNVAADTGMSEIRRYTIKNGQLDAASQRKLLEWPINRDSVDHSGGGMGFDPAGNLYVATGDNSFWTLNYGSVSEKAHNFNALRSAGNANDLRGKIIRIKPKPLAEADPAPVPGPGSTYDLPAGNLFPPDLAGTRPEIFVMGNRNPFSLTLDPATGWLFWADVGPQAGAFSSAKGPAGMDEFNVATTAGNYGWPMFVGPNLPYNKYDYINNVTGPLFDSTRPINDSRFNTGIQELPPSRGPLVSYGKDGKNNPWTGFQRGSAVPLAGPVYRYQGSNPSPYKLPPHFDGKWIIGDYEAGWLKVIAFDAKGEKAVDVKPVFQGLTFPEKMIDLKIGPDGALYVLEWGSQALSRIEYSGTCLPAVGLAPAFRKESFRSPRLLAGGIRHLALPVGAKGFTLFDLQGRRVWSYLGTGIGNPSVAELPSGLGHQVLRIRWE